MISSSHTLFISDLHLQSSQPKVLQLFFRFLQQQAPQAEALYILGDLFEVWLGDDDQQETYQAVKKELNILTKQGVPVYVIPGNRDFLLGKRFAQESGCQLLPDPTLIKLYDASVLLTHGDCLCTQDKRHQYFRKLTQQKWFQGLITAVPLALRQRVACRIRDISQQRTQRLAADIMDVTPTAVAKLMARYQTINLIHGHTHRPAIHRWTDSGKNFTRIVLGAWHQEGSVLIYNSNGHIQLTTIS